MVITILCGFILFHVFKGASSFNVDINAPVIKTGSADSLFGFSVMGHTHANGTKGILTGSPRAGVDGELYWCSLSQRICVKISVDIAELARKLDDDVISGALFGYSMSSLSVHVPSNVTVCAPRLTRSAVSLVYVSGGCFELDSQLRSAKVHMPSMLACQGIQEAAKSIDLRHCTMGASVGQHPSIPEELYMGGPYFYYAKGLGLVMDTKEYRRMLTSIDGLPPNSLVGSSLDVSDRIFAARPDAQPTVHVAYGGPGVPVMNDASETMGTGMVLLFPNRLRNEETSISPVSVVRGQRFGSRFGHCVLLLDVDGDGWDDLIVGAPYQQLKAAQGSLPEYGAVHIFINRQRTFNSPVDDSAGLDPFDYEPQGAHQLLTPTGLPKECKISSLSGYGATVAKIGDINHDGLQDFAVGAPFEDDGGAVFLYHGTRTGKIGLPAQVICTATLDSQLGDGTLKGLGFSIGLKGLDVDNNGYSDVAIGAPLSSTVVVLRTRPIIRFSVHVVLEDGTTVIRGNLDQLRDCTAEASTLQGYKASKVRCLEAKVFFTYTSIDGVPCSINKQYKVSSLIKADRIPARLHESDSAAMPFVPKKPDGSDQCKSSGMLLQRNSTVVNDFHRTVSFAPVSLIGERSIRELGTEAERILLKGNQERLADLDSHGGYLLLNLQATCRELSSEKSTSTPTPEELSHAAPVRIAFRDTNFVDQTKPVSIGAIWLADTPAPYPTASNMDEFPVANPRENKQLMNLSFDNRCSTKVCCPTLRISYSVNVTRDKHGPVVYVGDDKTQTISLQASVTNVGEDPAYTITLVSTYPPDLLELDPRAVAAIRITENTAGCHLGNPLWPGSTMSCSLRWLVVGHQLTVQLPNFTVNSTVLTGSSPSLAVDGSFKHELRVNIKMIANVSVTGIVEPNTVYFSGNVTDGISSISAENQMSDSRLLIRFTVINLRKHSLIPSSRLVIDWPYEIAGDPDEPHGKYMLYLLEAPYVTQHQLMLPGESGVNTTTTVKCDSRALTHLVNPHGYRIFRFLRPSSESVPVLLGPVDLPGNHSTTYAFLKPGYDKEPVPTRLTDIEKREKRIMTNISCYNGRLRCVPISCDLGKLSYKAGPITLELQARLWDNTLREDFKPFFLTNLRISATWKADVKYGIDLGDSDHASAMIELSIFNNLEPKPIVPKYMALYIGLAVFGGILLLAIIVIILKKAGFFKRRRFIRRPKKDLKNQTKPDYQKSVTEREPLYTSEQIGSQQYERRRPYMTDYRPHPGPYIQSHTGSTHGHAGSGYTHGPRTQQTSDGFPRETNNFTHYR
ncbi:unnamed protein product [Dicrocoelium dendriticum]|nr:unnamed protein product [Dicrocoelium dendriticum]